MKTRVRMIYDQVGGRKLYYVDRYTDFDSVTEDGRRLCHSTTGLAWRTVAVLPNEKAAKALAQRLTTKLAGDPLVIALFGVDDP